MLVGGAHAMHLPLTADGMAVLLACHAQEDIGAHVFEAHRLVTLPVDGIALHCPQIQVVTFAVLSKGTDLLTKTQTDRRQTRYWQTDRSAAQFVVMIVSKL